MTLRLSFFLILLVFAVTCKNTNDEDQDFLIKGYITGYLEGKVVLGKYQNDRLISVDSVFMTKSKFMFKHIKVESPEIYFLIVDDDQIIIEFFMDCNDIRINADYNTGGTLEVSGSKTHDEYVAFLENNLVFENKQREIYSQKEIAMSNNDTVLLQELDSMYTNVYKEQIDFIRLYIKENNASFVSVYIASRTLADNISLEELENLTSNFADTVRSSVYYNELKDKIEDKKRIQAGMQAPDFSLTDTSGINISLSSLQGKYVLLDFSASWHRPCRSRNSELQKIRKKYRDRGFEIYQVSFERDKNQWINVIETDKIDWICVSDLKALDSDIADLYVIRKFPTTFLLDKSGVIINNDVKIEELDMILERFL